jgi:hypothetical protein
LVQWVANTTWSYRKIVLHTLTLALPVAAAATVLVGLVYVVAQQTLRLSANDVPVALAQDMVGRLNAGTEPVAALPASRVELSDSLEPFVLVYDTRGQLVASSATLDGRAPAYPFGVLAEAAARGEERVTWQPSPSVRLASVARPWHDGVVVTGRSLQLTEALIDQLGCCAFLAGSRRLR